jgi:serine/threonine-protein kinase
VPALAVPATAAPVPAPPPAPQADIDATVRTEGGASLQLPVLDLTRGGLFLRAESGLPPLLSRVRVTLAHRTMRAPLPLLAEVVRHVSPTEAAAVHMAPGFALQFVDLTPEVRAALTELVDAANPPATPARARTAAEVDARLDALEARARADAYALLAVAPDVEFSAIRRAAGALREELELLRRHPLDPAHPGRAVALLGRVETAMAAVGAPAPRLAHDARTGNWRGVRRCLKAGVPEALIQARRESILAAEPARKEEAERQLARARVADKLKNSAAAAAAFEAALRADPLDLAAHEAVVAFEEARGG